MLTEEQLKEIEARANAARPAPWHVEVHEPTLSRMVRSDDHTLDIGFGYVGNRTEEDAEFVAHARTDVPALLAKARRLREENDKVTADLHVFVERNTDLVNERNGYYQQACEGQSELNAVVADRDRARNVAVALEQQLAEISRLAHMGSQSAGHVRRQILGVFAAGEPS